MKNESDILDVIQKARQMSPKYEVMLRLGVATGLRISDILRLRARSIKLSVLSVKEKKTGKVKRIEFTSELHAFLCDNVCVQGLRANDYLVFSHEAVGVGDEAD
jgi:integrase